jgi:glutamyl-tRNA reductase
MASSVQLMLVGTSHRTAPKALCECLHLDLSRRAKLDGALAKIEGLGAVVLCTCNRVELYCAAEGDEPLSRAREAFGEITGLAEAGFDRNGYERSGADAARHLMEVCAGLDSQMIGETEIMGQVKQAYAEASERGNVGPVLHRLFQKSFQAAKKAREDSGICVGQVSLGAVAVELARRIHGDLAASRILVVGSGQVGTDVARAMQLRGARDIVVTSRTPEHAAALAHEIGAKSATFETWRDNLREFDVVLLCTASPSTVLGCDDVRRAMKGRGTRPLFLLDLAMPPDAEPAIADLADVFLYTFADLAAAANENRRGRMGEVEHCRQDIVARADRLWADIVSRAETQGPGDPVANAKHSEEA